MPMNLGSMNSVNPDFFGPPAVLLLPHADSTRAAMTKIGASLAIRRDVDRAFSLILYLLLLADEQVDDAGWLPPPQQYAPGPPGSRCPQGSRPRAARR